MRKPRWGRIIGLIVVVVIIYVLVVLTINIKPAELDKEDKGVPDLSKDPTAQFEAADIVFYYSSSSESTEMALLVNKFKDNYVFEQVDAFADDVDFSGVLPSLECVESKEILEGKVSESELVEFAEGCVE